MSSLLDKHKSLQQKYNQELSQLFKSIQKQFEDCGVLIQTKKRLRSSSPCDDTTRRKKTRITTSSSDLSDDNIVDPNKMIQDTVRILFEEIYVLNDVCQPNNCCKFQEMFPTHPCLSHLKCPLYQLNMENLTEYFLNQIFCNVTITDATKISILLFLLKQNIMEIHETMIAFIACSPHYTLSFLDFCSQSKELSIHFTQAIITQILYSSSSNLHNTTLLLYKDLCKKNPLIVLNHVLHICLNDYTSSFSQYPPPPSSSSTSSSSFFSSSSSDQTTSASLMIHLFIQQIQERKNNYKNFSKRRRPLCEFFKSDFQSRIKYLFVEEFIEFAQGETASGLTIHFDPKDLIHFLCQILQICSITPYIAIQLDFTLLMWKVWQKFTYNNLFLEELVNYYKNSDHAQDDLKNWFEVVIMKFNCVSDIYGFTKQISNIIKFCKQVGIFPVISEKTQHIVNNSFIDPGVQKRIIYELTQDLYDLIHLYNPFIETRINFPILHSPKTMFYNHGYSMNMYDNVAFMKNLTEFNRKPSGFLNEFVIQRNLPSEKYVWYKSMSLNSSSSSSDNNNNINNNDQNESIIFDDNEPIHRIFQTINSIDISQGGEEENESNEEGGDGNMIHNNSSSSDEDELGDVSYQDEDDEDEDDIQFMIDEEEKAELLEAAATAELFHNGDHASSSVASSNMPLQHYTNIIYSNPPFPNYYDLLSNNIKEETDGFINVMQWKICKRLQILQTIFDNAFKPSPFDSQDIDFIYSILTFMKELFQTVYVQFCQVLSKHNISIDSIENIDSVDVLEREFKKIDLIMVMFHLIIRLGEWFSKIESCIQDKIPDLKQRWNALLHNYRHIVFLGMRFNYFYLTCPNSTNFENHEQWWSQHLPINSIDHLKRRFIRSVAECDPNKRAIIHCQRNKMLQTIPNLFQIYPFQENNRSIYWEYNPDIAFTNTSSYVNNADGSIQNFEIKEPAIGRGVLVDFITTSTEQMFSAEYSKFFNFCPVMGCFVPKCLFQIEDSNEYELFAETAGFISALAFRQNIKIPFCVAPLFLMDRMWETPLQDHDKIWTLERLSLYDAEQAQNLSKLMEYTNQDEHFLDENEFYFEYTMDNFTKDTIPIISNTIKQTTTTRVTRQNINHYITCMIRTHLWTSKIQFWNKFMQGFKRVIERRFLQTLHFLNDKRAMYLFCGNSNMYLSFDYLKSQVKYSGGFCESSPTIVNFWIYFHSLSSKSQEEILRFWTAYSKVSPSLSLIIKKMSCHDVGHQNSNNATFIKDMFLPFARTCDLELSIPDYSSFNALKKKFDILIELKPKSFGEL
jgi:hypothetical protein